ncbi:unnamed protein product [Rotaria socialis]|uniref:B box-type domain-containing protein n=1 Tax=Rotaria socialis TaxID=392032 RepID=A0A817WHJ0_9BILA|nr:unnamed protein product [Rotaria socialis]CAF4777691.1 unnamed protein product [Rotaria socialis]
MALSTTKRSLCKKCSKTLSIFICPGCQSDLCTEHANEHREELARQLEKVVLDHDQLTQLIVDQKSEPHHHPLMKQINEWETQSTAKIHQVAEDARTLLLDGLNTHTNNISEALKRITQELTKARTDSNFIETELVEWTKRLNDCKKNLQESSTIGVHQDDKTTSFISKIFVSVTANDVFDRLIGEIQIEEMGHVIVQRASPYSHTAVLGKFEYTTGEHRFRFKVEQYHENKWIFFGILSKNVTLQACPHTTSSSYGWVARGNEVVLNGSCQPGYNGYKNEMKVNDTVSLCVNCAEQNISLVNERTQCKYEIPVDLSKCPFPWQLYLGLFYLGDRVRILP